MNETVNLGVLPEYFIETLLIRDIDIVVCWLLSTDALDPIQDFFRRVVEVVNNDHFVVGFEQGKNSQGADVASATKYMSVLSTAVTEGRHTQ